MGHNLHPSQWREWESLRGEQSSAVGLALAGLTVQTFGWHQPLDYGKMILYWLCCSDSFLTSPKCHWCPSSVFNNPLLHPAQGRDTTNRWHLFTQHKITLFTIIYKGFFFFITFETRNLCPLIVLSGCPLVQLGGCTPLWDATPDVCVRL